MVMVAQERSATSRGLSPASAPSPTSSSTGPRERECTTSSWPARIRLRAMGRPMMPSPTKPTLSPATVRLLRALSAQAAAG